MAKKAKKSAARTAGKFIRRVAKNPAVSSALGLGGDGLTTLGVPAGISFVGARLVGYLAKKLAGGNGNVAAWRKALAPHAPVLAHAFLIALIWYGSTKSKFLRKYRTGLLIGTGVSALLTVLQSYILKPKALPAPQAQPQMPPEEPSYPRIVEPDYDDQSTVGMSDAEFAEYQTGNFAQ